ncbi:MGH1-like glycoside hydrolase domain-containing protein [Granulicella sibirica]|uniref:Glycoside hydrolase, family 37 n=1 Tax=Granulicella sibirica TaxID=2479048 RepID=A0A4Q0T7A1_9BACT|nr:alpha-L-rhamnosidase [Granulicella sibirica]RXH58580.1 glycoside hydrolase, family 37 [Granulicella sibirica]
MSQTRRTFLQTAALAATARVLHATAPDAGLDSTRADAIATVAGNIRILPPRPDGYSEPMLIEGSTYNGVWMECGPHEALVWAHLAEPHEGTPSPMQVARNNHMAFFALQRPDGQFPSACRATSTGFEQIQMVISLAATAWELSRRPGLPDAQHFLETAYSACSKWDAWLRQYRDTRKTGLAEGFCTYDTGHDNSPRWAGIPNRCLDGDARKCPPIPTLPRLCPDLSATVYGGRIALAAMARTLGKPDEEARWLADAEHIRRLILTKLYSPEDGAFYDLDAQNNFVRVRSDVISRVLGEHVLDLSQPADKRIFEDVWTKQIHNPKAFWAPYPLSSIAQDDPVFVRPIPRNSWGGASQALTALRTPRWMSHYGKEKELRHMMQQWVEAVARAHRAEPGGAAFRQQMDPQTGVFTLPDPGGYSPCALVFLDFQKRLGLHGPSKPA